VVVESSFNWNKPYFLMNFIGLVVDWFGIWWIKILPIIDEVEGCEEEEPPIPLPPPEDVYMKWRKLQVG
jgi:hypothetical protein